MATDCNSSYGGGSDSRCSGVHGEMALLKSSHGHHLVHAIHDEDDGTHCGATFAARNMMYNFSYQCKAKCTMASQPESLAFLRITEEIARNFRNEKQIGRSSSQNASQPQPYCYRKKNSLLNLDKLVGTTCNLGERQSMTQKAVCAIDARNSQL